MARFSRRLTFILAALGMLILTACGAGNGGTQPPPDDTVEVPESTKVMDQATTDALLSLDEDGTLRFSSETDVIASLEDGDVFVGGMVDDRAPNGFLRTVTEVRTENGEVVVETENATLTDAIDRANVSIRQQVSSQHVVGATHHAPGITLIAPQQGDSEFEIDFSETLLSVEGVDVSVNGGFAFDAEMLFDLEIDKSKPLEPASWVRRFKAAVLLEERSDLELVATGTIDESARQELTTLQIANIQFAIGPVPVVIVANLTFFLEFDGSLSAELTTGVVQTASLEVGGLYTYADGWSGINEPSSSFEFTPPTLEVEAQARASTGATISVGLYTAEAAAGTITGRAFLEADASASGFPLWCLYGGLNASYGYVVAIPKIDVTISEYEKVFAEYRQEVACAENTPPSVSITNASDGATFEEATEVTIQAQANDLENSATISWNVDGSLDVEPTGSSYSISTLCPGDHTVTATAEDEQGATSSASVTITIVNQAPSVRITEAPASVGVTNDVKLRGTVTDPTCEDPNGKNVNLDSLVWDLEDGFGGTGAGILGTFTEQGDKTVTLAFTDAAGATDTATTEITVEEFDADAPLFSVVKEPQDGATYELEGDEQNGSCDPAYAIDVSADVSSSVDDADVVWSFRSARQASFSEFARGRDAVFERDCVDISGAAGLVDYDLRVHIDGEPMNDDTTDTVTIQLRHLGT